jgi:hypothetical protein
VADHLDVIGHYPSGFNQEGEKEPAGGITFFDSEAHFRDEEFQQFWRRVAAMLREQPPKSLNS